MDKKEITLQQLYWRTRRGVLELDFILSKYWHACAENLDSAEKVKLAKLLECQDPELLDYLVYRTSIPLDRSLAEIVAEILYYIDSH